MQILNLEQKAVKQTACYAYLKHMHYRRHSHKLGRLCRQGSNYRIVIRAVLMQVIIQCVWKVTVHLGYGT
jgi:hypothetical protein